MYFNRHYVVMDPLQTHVNVLRTVKKTQTRVIYPVHIYCIVDDYADAGSTLIQSIKARALAAGAIVSTRYYDSQKYSDDRNIITRLPAFHVYIENSYDRTFYPNTRPLQHVDESVETYLKRVEARQLRSRAWSMYFQRCKAWIKRLLHRRTRMEQYKEDMERTGLREWT